MKENIVHRSQGVKGRSMETSWEAIAITQGRVRSGLRCSGHSRSIRMIQFYFRGWVGEISWWIGCVVWQKEGEWRRLALPTESIEVPWDRRKRRETELTGYYLKLNLDIWRLRYLLDSMKGYWEGSWTRTLVLKRKGVIGIVIAFKVMRLDKCLRMKSPRWYSIVYWWRWGERTNKRDLRSRQRYRRKTRQCGVWEGNYFMEGIIYWVK